MEKMPKKIGVFFLVIWLVAWGLITLIQGLNGLELILAVLAIAVGILIFLDHWTKAVLYELNGLSCRNI